jgi:hypothetical protein
MSPLAATPRRDATTAALRRAALALPHIRAAQCEVL